MHANPMVERFADAIIDNQNVRLNLMQPHSVEEVMDSDLPKEKTSSEVLASFREHDETPKNLPEASFRIVDVEQDEDFEFPSDGSYLKYRIKTAEELDAMVEYSVDEEDVIWLKLMNELFKKNGDRPLSERDFEYIIDRLEKESFFQCASNEGTSNSEEEADQNAVCCVCNNGDDDNGNQIIFCDMCNIAVHQDCYGVPYIPEGQWLCRRCYLSPSVPVKCALCPSTIGAFKQTDDNRWVHVACALYLNEVHFANTVFMEPAEGVENSLRRRCKLRCMICKEKYGACLQCAKRSCVRSFHVTCAFAYGMDMRTEVVRSKTNPGQTEIKYSAFCHYHSSKTAREDLPSASSKQQKIARERIRKVRAELSASHRSEPAVSVPVIFPKKAARLRHKFRLSEFAMNRILAYWGLKRRSRAGVPLIRRLMFKHNRVTHRSNGHTQFHEEEPHGMTVEATCAGVLRAQFERTRLLSELVMKREKNKRAIITQLKEAWSIAAKPLFCIMDELLEKIESKDYSQVFANVVTDKDVPGYSTVIKKPMAIATMKKKLVNGSYKKLSQLKSDFDLMINNCSTFNRHNEFFWKYGHRLRRISAKFFSAAEIQEKLSNLSMDSGISTLQAQKLLILSDQCLKDDIEVNNRNEMPKSSSFGLREKRLSTSLAERSVVDEDSVPLVAGGEHSKSSGRKRQLPNIKTQASTKKRKEQNKAPQSSAPRFITPESRSMENAGRPPLRVSRASFTNINSSAFGVYRDARTNNFLDVTDNSSTVESSSADEESEPVMKAGKGRRGRKPRWKRSCSTVRPTIDTVEIGCDFQHDDIVWVDENSRMVGRVIDPRMKIYITDPDINEVLATRPAEFSQFTLIQFFDEDRTWRWVPSKFISQCDLQTVQISKYNRPLQYAIKQARVFRDKASQK
ncbi:hypothetical protein AB6A40_003428 [Gnathostoma spinigerum]|uniref:Bromodomain and PHD finger-containing protein n=1 Tax=Gnathostoma spinigerum TaxID=75299 RepID=A0ABD6EF25_9BILA